MSDYRNRPGTSSSLTASHLMLFIILFIYIVIVVFGILFAATCLIDKDYSSGTQVLIALFSYSGVCGSSTIIVYTNKASKENEIKIANNKYKMKVELAKDIFKNISNNSLDDKSIILMKILSDNSDNLESTVQNVVNPIEHQNVQLNSDEALG